MDEQNLKINLFNYGFKVFLDINCDLKQNKSCIITRYAKKPKDLKYMCASLLLCTAMRILWIAETSDNYKMINLYRRFQSLSDLIQINNSPLNSSYVKIICEGNVDEYNFNLTYEGFGFFDKFVKDISEVTVYSFFALYKYISEELLPLGDNLDFYEELIKVLYGLTEYSLENLTQMQRRQICMENAIYLAFEL